MSKTVVIKNDWRGEVRQERVKPGLTIEYVTEPSQAVLDLRAAGPDTSARDAQIAEINALDSIAKIRDYLKREKGLI